MSPTLWAVPRQTPYPLTIASLAGTPTEIGEQNLHHASREIAVFRLFKASANLRMEFLQGTVLIDIACISSVPITPAA